MIHKALERQNCPALRASVDANGGEEVVWECPWGGDHVLGRVEDGYLKTADEQWPDTACRSNSTRTGTSSCGARRAPPWPSPDPSGPAPET